MDDAFELIVIGAGQAGPFLAARMAQQGRRVALVEARELGGTCVNRGCTPTKTLRKSARVAYLARRAGEFGVRVGPVEVDFRAAMERMQARVETARSGLESFLGAAEGLSVFMARGRLAGRDGANFLVSVGERMLSAPRVVLNTGTRPSKPPIPGLAEVPHLDNESLLALRERPHKLVIIGGSYIGLEMGQIFRRLGSEVAVIEAGPRLTAHEDADVSAAITAMLAEEGLDIFTGVGIDRVAPNPLGGGVSVHLADGRVISGSHLLVAAGRTPNTNDLGLETVGLVTDARGFLETDDHLATKVGGIWALGDINKRGAFTHTSYHDFEVLFENWTSSEGRVRSVATRIPTYAMFTDPPLGHVGIYEADARQLVAKGRRISQAVIAMKDVSRAKEESETAGLIKLLIDDDSGAFLGASMLGLNADEIIQIIGQVMAAGGTWRTVREALPVHPTVAEFLPTLIDRRKPLT
ncbi:MAG TPA: mercuric reductase [Burkholderiaceae bacterium]|jgi:pyruvate/2-oxoglutarate dehydrogenase complex dihydrolipoamide dehydrogenase (E3) component